VKILQQLYLDFCASAEQGLGLAVLLMQVAGLLVQQPAIAVEVQHPPLNSAPIGSLNSPSIKFILHEYFTGN
jgi:hypothetical protein